MKLSIISDKGFYNRIPMIKEELEKYGHEVVLPIDYDKPDVEDEFRFLGRKKYAEFKKEMLKQNQVRIKNVDGVLVLNFNKGMQENYIGGTTFLEMYDTFSLKKDIYLWNSIPNNDFKDEIIGFSPTIINGNVARIPMTNRIQKNILYYLKKYESKEEPLYNSILSAIAEGLRIEKDICQKEIKALLMKEMIDVVSKEQISSKIDYYRINDKGSDYLENSSIKHKIKVKSL